MAEESRILGPDGRPIRKQELTREIAAPSLTGVRQTWDARTVASGLTPELLAVLLRSAAEGDHRDYLTLAMEMEERDMHYFSVLATRKLAITGLEPVVEAASEEARDVEIADAVRELVRRPEFTDAVDESLDGLGKGFSAVEIMWDRSERQWWPGSYLGRDQRHFVFDRDDGRTLRMLDEEDSMLGIRLPAYKFIVHMPRIRSGLPIRRGFARLAAVGYMCKAYAVTDWVAFAEVFGMPLRIGRYGPSATDHDIGTLINAVANLGTDAAAVLPDSMRIDFQEAGNRQGAVELFERLAEFMDKQLSKAVLGQVATTEGTPGRLGSDDAQDEVRQDIKKADAVQVANTINRDLIRPFVDLNYGPQKAYPRVQFPVHEPEDLTALADALTKLVPLNLGVEASWARDKFGVPDPEEGAELLGVPATPAAELPALNRQERACVHCGVAHNREAPPEGDEIDRLVEEAASDWEAQLGPVVDPIQQLADSASSYDEFLRGLPAVLSQMDTDEAVRHLAKAAFRSRGLGDATDEVS